MYVKGRLEAAESKRSIAEDFSVPESTEREAEDRDTTDFRGSLQTYVFKRGTERNNQVITAEIQTPDSAV